MAKKLVIVESPTKAKTIRKFLGSTYQVIASEGHVRDLPKSQMGVDIANDFEPHYITIRGKGDVLSELKTAAKKADVVYLATDPDREGEAISWHLAIALGIEPDKASRITFNEITKQAVREAMKHSRAIDQDLVDAQQARRVLDRIVGYQMSPLLWKKIKKGLSAGRVQAACLSLLSEREKDIADFEQKEFWTIDTLLENQTHAGTIKMQVSAVGGEKTELANQADTQKICKEIEKAGAFKIQSIRTGKRSRKAPEAFTTSTLQQEASRKLGFSPQKTMSIAQMLYEGVELAGLGQTGLITYLRTDSTRIAEEMQQQAAEYIRTKIGEDYVASSVRRQGKGRRIQDAHEAIRPTNLMLDPKSIEDSLSKDQFRLYQLIYFRFLASRMAPCEYETQHIVAENQASQGQIRLEASGSVLRFPGFLKVYQDEEKTDETLKGFKEMKEGDILEVKSILPEQHFTQPPARYTEGLLVRAMEENGVGRPSTYAPTITTLISRGYVSKEKKALYVTELGSIVHQMSADYFKSINDIGFTAQMESELDQVEDGQRAWKDVIREFYATFEPQLVNAEKEMEKVTIQDEVTDEICDVCGRHMVLKMGRFGKFYACPGFPECRNTKPYLEKIGVKCPLCGKDVLVRRSRKGRTYYGCEDNPTCSFMSWDKPTSEVCPKCGHILYEKQGRIRKLVCLEEGCGYKKEIEETEE
ncbi:MAG: type I DNA topoisomerase [Firmicutes bacterium]|nr:type I DNA topoisomerase [Bacillota bacterium]